MTGEERVDGHDVRGPVPRRAPGWYVVQTTAGSEEHVRALIERQVASELYDECFVPRYKTAQKVGRGKWAPCELPLFPGYLMVITEQVRELADALRGIKAFSKLLDCNGAFIPLNEAEVAWIDAFTQRGHRVIGMSEGYVEGDEIVVTSGPLMNRTGWIRKVNHRKKRAYLELELFGRTIQAEVGLRIVRKRS